MSDTTAPARTSGSARRSPTVVSVLAGVGVLLVVVGLLALVSPSVRAQVALSTTRQDAPYVETYFADVAQAMSCNEGRPRFRAAVSVRSHLEEGRSVPVVLTLVPAGGGAPTVAQAEVATQPGQVATVEVAARKPVGAYDARVSFPGRDQRLVVHCDGVAR